MADPEEFALFSMLYKMVYKGAAELSENVIF